MKKRKNGRRGVAYAFGLIGISFLISVVLSAAIIIGACEVFAFLPQEGEQTVVIPEGATTDEVAHILHEAGLVRFPLLYRLYAKVRSWSGSYLVGEFTLNSAMSYDEMRYALAPKKGAREQIRVTIPEGFTTDEIIDRFVALGIGTREGFAQVIEEGGTFGYDFLADIPQVEGRTYRLDGYLFPDTYFVYADSNETEIITKLLSNFNRKFDERLRAEAAAAGYSVDEIVRLASIIEREAYYREDMPLIASVFANRLKSGRFPCLESDATVKYAKELTGSAEALTAADIDGIDSPYNTYRQKGLPPGAICSPGYDAIAAAVHPADTDYYYFLSMKDRSTVFSRTYAEHKRAVENMRR